MAKISIFPDTAKLLPGKFGVFLYEHGIPVVPVRKCLARCFHPETVVLESGRWWFQSETTVFSLLSNARKKIYYFLENKWLKYLVE